MVALPSAWPLASNDICLVGSTSCSADQWCRLCHRFIIIAPDSHNSLTWFPPDNSTRPFTEDYYHILACYRWVKTIPGVGATAGTVLFAADSAS